MVKRFIMPGIAVNALCATDAGVVYAGTDMGIYVQREDRWERVFPTTKPLGAGANE